MKKLKVLSLLMLFSLTGLTACQNGSSKPSSVTHTTVAPTTTVTPTTETPTTTVAPTTETPTTVAPTTTATPTTTPVENDFDASISILSFDGTSVKESIVEGTGAYRIKVEVSNLPSSKTVDDCEFKWPLMNAIVSYENVPDSTWGKNEKQFIVNFAGSLDIKVEVTCGELKSEANLTFEITKNESLYTNLDTVAKFKEMLNSPIPGQRYQLTKNLDLGGYVHRAGDLNTVCNSLIDGNGYTVSNFTVGSITSGDATGVGSGLFKELGRGIVRNLHLVGKVDAVRGFGGLICHTVQYLGLIENCLLEADNISTIAGDWSWQRNGVIAGCVKGLVRDVVSINASVSTEPSISNQMISTAPYGYYNGTDALFALENVYTNVTDSALAVPFDASGIHDWGMVGNDHENIDVTIGLNDFSTTVTTDFDLDATIWTLVNGQMPKLAHYGDTAVTE